MFRFFFADEDLMLDTLGVKLYEAIHMVDLVFMILMVQTHPYYKGMFMDRRAVITVIVVAAAGALVLGMVFAHFIDNKNATKYMMFVSLVSIFFYPISATLINMVSFKSKYLAIIVFGSLQCIKMTMNYMMREALREIINESVKEKAENFKALGFFVECVFKALSFGIFGWIITKAMKSFRIQQLNPYNYFFAFLILSLPLIVSWILLNKSKQIKDRQVK
jgi:hypothetical protein